MGHAALALLLCRVTSVTRQSPCPLSDSRFTNTFRRRTEINLPHRAPRRGNPAVEDKPCGPTQMQARERHCSPGGAGGIWSTGTGRLWHGPPPQDSQRIGVPAQSRLGHRTSRLHERIRERPQDVASAWKTVWDDRPHEKKGRAGRRGGQHSTAPTAMAETLLQASLRGVPPHSYRFHPILSIMSLRNTRVTPA